MVSIDRVPLIGGETMNFVSAIIDLIFPPVEPDETHEETALPADSEKAAPVSADQLVISMYEPRNLEEAREVVSFMIEKNHAAFVNLSRLSRPDALRMQDYICGAAFAANGEVRMIDRQIILCGAAPFIHAGE